MDVVWCQAHAGRNPSRRATFQSDGVDEAPGDERDGPREEIGLNPVERNHGGTDGNAPRAISKHTM